MTKKKGKDARIAGAVKAARRAGETVETKQEAYHHARFQPQTSRCRVNALVGDIKFISFIFSVDEQSTHTSSVQLFNHIWSMTKKSDCLI